MHCKLSFAKQLSSVVRWWLKQLCRMFLGALSVFSQRNRQQLIIQWCFFVISSLSFSDFLSISFNNIFLRTFPPRANCSISGLFTHLPIKLNCATLLLLLLPMRPRKKSKNKNSPIQSNFFCMCYRLPLDSVVFGAFFIWFSAFAVCLSVPLGVSGFDLIRSLRRDVQPRRTWSMGTHTHDIRICACSNQLWKGWNVSFVSVPCGWYCKGIYRSM